MSKYRIVERKYSDDTIIYVCEKKVLWFWGVLKSADGNPAFFDTFEEAKRFLPRKIIFITEEKVVFESD